MTFGLVRGFETENKQRMRVLVEDVLKLENWWKVGNAITPPVQRGNKKGKEDDIGKSNSFWTWTKHEYAEWDGGSWDLPNIKSRSYVNDMFNTSCNGNVQWKTTDKVHVLFARCLRNADCLTKILLISFPGYFFSGKSWKVSLSV